MKARITKTEEGTYLLCSDGTVLKADKSQLRMFLTNFDQSDIFSGKSIGKEKDWHDLYLDITEYPGETLAYVTNDNKLVINDVSFMQDILKDHETVDYVPQLLSALEYAKKHNRSKEVIKAYLNSGLIIGAKKVGRQWVIPEDAPYPVEEQSQKPNAGRRPEKKD